MLASEGGLGVTCADLVEAARVAAAVTDRRRNQLRTQLALFKGGMDVREAGGGDGGVLEIIDVLLESFDTKFG